MKRVKSLVALCLAVSLLVGCGGKPKDVSEDMYELGVKALEVLDDYLSADLGIDEASEKISRIKDRMVEDEKYESDKIVQLIVGAIEAKMLLVIFNPEKYEKEKMEEFRENKKALAEKLGK